MAATPALTAALAQQVTRMAEDLRDRVAEVPEVGQRWRAEHTEALRRKRTATSWTAWRDDRVDQAAVAWVLFTVFVRFCEDNALVSPVWIAGPPDRRREATDAQAAYFRANPEHTDREWLDNAVAHFASVPATAGLVDEHSALHLVSPSGQATEALLAFWRERDAEGALQWDLGDPELSTRFLGDLYQDLSEHAKSTYALLQTPDFVEEFILDRTLEPALADRPLEGFRLIDPTCGSGHFLLGAFARLLDRWHRHAPGLGRQARVQEALDAIHGVDLNPFAVAIARFRLTLAALQACELRSLEAVPAFRFHLAVGDSLLHGPGQLTLDADTDLSRFTYSTEDLTQLQQILAGGRYDAVVGNPPYITVKDKELNAAYRARYTSCRGTYALSVPFMERFFGLAKHGLDGQPAGWVGQITSNSFMKRDFGIPLVREFLTGKDLRLIVDTSGAYIPGHGTPTVIIVGRPQRPVKPYVRAVLGTCGEIGRVADPKDAPVWSSIRDHVDDLGFSNRWITVADVERTGFIVHPWSLTGGAAPQLRQTITANPTLTSIAGLGFTVGGLVTTGEDSAYTIGGVDAVQRKKISFAKQLIEGECLSDFEVRQGEYVIFPYDDTLTLVDLNVDSSEYRHLWTLRTVLENRRRFGRPMGDLSGVRWDEYRELYPARLAAQGIAVFRKISTHNHCVRDTEGRLFREACHSISGSDPATLEKVVASLNSTVGCFWLKEMSYNKGEGGGARVAAGFAARGEPFRDTYEFAGGTLGNFPLNPNVRADRAARVTELTALLHQSSPETVVHHAVPSRLTLAEAKECYDAARQELVALQEELDWDCYASYGLVAPDDGAILSGRPPGLYPGQRAFEIALAQQWMLQPDFTTWFTHEAHDTKIHQDPPEHWPANYREVVERRLGLLQSDPVIALLEQPTYKRRWLSADWEAREKASLRGWLLDRLEARAFWFDPQGRPRPRSMAQIGDELARDTEWMQVLELWAGRPDTSVSVELGSLLEDETVPYLAALRYRESGMRKRLDWEEMWHRQRQRDAGASIARPTVPPAFTAGDFRKPAYWRHRGKFDIAKERFIAYPEAGRATDPTPLLGWGGWDHAQQSLALARIIQERDADGADESTLIPLIAGMAELQPWLDQWHAEIDPTYGVSPAAFCREQLTTRAHQVSHTLDQLATWRPSVTAGRGRRRN